MDKRGGGGTRSNGVSGFSVENWSYSAEKFRWGNPSVLRFRKFPVAKSLWIRGRGEYQGFPSKVFRLMVPKNFVGELFSVSLFSGVENFCASQG